METNNIFFFIKGIELFKGLDEHELMALAKNIQEKNYSKGQLLFEENGPRKDIFIIFKGEVELFKTLHFGAETRLS